MNFNSRSDESFLNQLTTVIEKNLNNNQFGVTQLSKEFGKSRSYIHRKLKSITNQSISHYIRSVRLEKAMEILKEKEISAAEVSYDVGFSSPTYFNHCFHEYFGFPPGEVKNRIKELNKEEKPVSKNIYSAQLNKINSFLKRKSVIKLLLVSFLFSILILLYGTWYFFLQRDLSIIVLPFENLTNSENTEFFAESIREDILNDLYQITDLRVISRATAEQFRNSNLTARQIAKKVKVKYVLKGSVREYGDHNRLRVQLIDAYAFRENHVWSENYNLRLNDILGVHDEISLKVATSINSSIPEKEIKQFNKPPTKNSEAYNYYLQARFLHHKALDSQRFGFDAEGVKNSVKYYELAIAEDGQFAEAYAGLAKAWFNLSAWGILGSKEGFVKAKEYSLKAIEIDEECAEAHCVLGGYFVWAERNFDKGGRELETSIRLNPGYATSRQWYAQYLMITGPIEKSREQVNIALELEPYFWVVQNLNAWIYYFEENYEESLEACIVAHDYNSGFSSNHWLFVLNYARLGEGEKMKKQLQFIAKQYSKSDAYEDSIQHAFDTMGIDGLLLWMIETNQKNPIQVEGLNGHPFFTAWWYALLKNKIFTVFWLEKTLEEKNIPYHYFNLIATNPDFDFVRNDSIFLSVVDNAGLSNFQR